MMVVNTCGQMQEIRSEMISEYYIEGRGGTIYLSGTALCDEQCKIPIVCERHYLQELRWWPQELPKF